MHIDIVLMRQKPVSVSNLSDVRECYLVYHSISVVFIESFGMLVSAISHQCHFLMLICIRNFPFVRNYFLNDV